MTWYRNTKLKRNDHGIAEYKMKMWREFTLQKKVRCPEEQT